MEYTPVEQIIRERIAASGGRISFAAYMEACLYEPGLGYYTSPGRKVGAEGDFYTSISVNASFGRVLARDAVRVWKAMGRPEAFALAEPGAGNGRLACDILDYIAEREPELYSGVSHVLIDREPSLENAQRDMLKRHAEKVSWMPPETFLSNGSRFSGFIYSNELFDALPVHRVLMTAEGLREIFVTATEEGFSEEAGVPSTAELDQYLEKAGVGLYQGQIAEISLAGPMLMAGIAGAMRQGVCITIDYGYPAPELYSPHRKNGTLLCYYRHQVEENPYIRAGLQDITAHVDFTALKESGEADGLRQIWFGEQYRYLLASGMVEEFEEIEASDCREEEKMKARLALKKLILPGGMGDTFKVLVQSKGLENLSLPCMAGIAR